MILVVDDESYIRSSLAGLLADEGYVCLTASSAEEGETVLERETVDLILLDLQMPGKGGLTFLEDNRSRLAGIPVIIISGRGDIPTAVSAIRLGAYDYIEKPLVPQRVLVTVAKALELSAVRYREEKLAGQMIAQHAIIGRSNPIMHLHRLIEKAAASDASVLIFGENGSGKELVAHNIHLLSKRRTEPLVVVNCPAIPEPLFESELFGHLKGAFTGATSDRVGRFGRADGGTLFLDEIGDLPLPLQGKLLRVLESGEFEKVGSDRTEKSNCRIVAATNRDLKALISEERFRQDLFYRLNVLTLIVPPLRERPDDIPILIEHFLGEFQADLQYRWSADGLARLVAYHWPGNVRELRNIVNQLIFTCEPGEISAAAIDHLLAGEVEETASAPQPGENRLHAAVRQFESGLLARLYQTHDGNIAAMARELGLDRANLSRKLRHLGIV